MFISGLLLMWLIQLMTHYSNEYWDLETDRATELPTHISGGSRILVRGLVPRRAARVAAEVSLSLALALTILVVAVRGAGNLAMALVGVALLVGWFYSTPPLRLESRGVGEVAIVLVACLLLPSTAYYLQASALSLSLLRACVPLALLTFGLTLATELPDIAADRATGKRTLVVRVGAKRAVWLQGAFLAVGWLSLVAVTAPLWPFWGWVVGTASAPLVALSFVSVRASSQGHIAAMERMGLIHSMVLGYGTLALGVATVLG
jgi:1,4-dihydroxy-2-naphthoate octaprenyltransferase